MSLFKKQSRRRMRLRCLALELLESRSMLTAYFVNHTPYLQPGNAPLIGFAGSATDQVQILWQTVPQAGITANDSFVVDYRAVGATNWIPAGPVSTLDTATDNRVNHFVDIVGLGFDANYEYRVQHLRDSALLTNYQASFRTRLPAGATTPFSFVAYGDSAYTATVGDFRSVQSRISQINPAFAVLLGDNVYYSGTHDELDARFDPSINPEAAAWNSTHIDYYGFGNHDIVTDEGKPTEDNIAVPIPVTGNNAPAQPPATERDEHNYSFDYGNVHFVTFDTNSYNSETPDPNDFDQRLNAVLSWVEQDLAASTAKWKIVYGHHPIGGAPDKSENPNDNYYRQIVPRLRAAGVDLFLTGHSHTFSWTYPLLGNAGSNATYVADTDKSYSKGAGLIQVIAGMGGFGPRPGSYGSYPFVASGFTTSTNPPSRFGFAKIDVTPTQLTVKYVAADDGSTIDQFSIVDSALLPQVSITAVDGIAAEQASNTGLITISRTGSTVDPLTVGYTIGGSAQNGTDYGSLPLQVTIPAGQASVDITITPLDDTVPELLESVDLVLNSSPSYVFAGVVIASVGVADNDSVTKTFAQATDTYLHQTSPNTNFGQAVSLTVDGENNGGIVQTLLCFDNLFGNGATQIPPSSPQIVGARLELSVTNPGDGILMHRLLQSWQDSSTWNSWVNGVQTNNVEARTAVDAATSPLSTGPLTINVVNHVQAWLADPGSNFGWVFIPTGTDGVAFDSNEGTNKPKLVVTYAVAPPPSLGVAAVSSDKAEGTSGLTEFTFQVARTGTTTGVTTVEYALTGSGPHPVEASDFVGDVWPSGVLTFLNGETVKTIVVPVKSDRNLERDEGFVVTLSNPGDNAAIGSSTAAGTIRNDDLNRRLFYHRSTSSVFGDGSGNPTGSIDPDKQALLPGETADTIHYTNYSRGLNGILVDGYALSGLGTGGLQFATWNGLDVGGFVPLAAVPTVTVLNGGGLNGSDRVKIEFADGAVKNTWLRVTVLATGSGLAANDVFYFGNAVADMYAGNIGSPITVRTNATDTALIRQNQSINPNSVGITSLYDVNKDGRVNATDTALARQNQSNQTILLFTAPTALKLADESLAATPPPSSPTADESLRTSLQPMATRRKSLLIPDSSAPVVERVRLPMTDKPSRPVVGLDAASTKKSLCGQAEWMIDRVFASLDLPFSS